MTKPKHSGFVLLLVLVVLAVGGTLVAIAARRCGQDAVRAGAMRSDLQLKWGRLSCQATLLPLADKLLQDQDGKATLGDPPCLEVQQTLTLGGMKFFLIVGDESAKANANVLGKQSPGQAPQTAQVALTRGVTRLQGGARQIVPPQLRPLKTPIKDDPNLSVFYPTLEHVLAVGQPSELVGDPAGDGANLRRRLTCWGSGKLDIHRADLAAMQEILGPYVTNGSIAQIDQARRQAGFNLQDCLGRMQLTQGQLPQVTPLITDSPDCYSLWIVVKGTTRTWYSLSIHRMDSGGSVTDEFFDW